MLPSRFLVIFILLILFSFSPGTGRKVITRDLSEITDSALWIDGRRGMEEMVMDYKEPGANTNPRAGLPPPEP